MAFLLKNSLKLNISKQFLKAYCLSGQQLQQKTFKTTTNLYEPHKQKTETTLQTEAVVSTNAQKKPKDGIKITLIQNQNMTVTALEEAKSLAKRRSMHLVKIQDMDPKTHRPVYK